MRRSSIDPEALVAAIELDPRFSAAFLYGSAAKGELRADSDVDLAVVYVDDEARRSAQSELLQLLGSLSVAAGGRAVHLVDLEAAEPSLRLQVFRQAIRLLERDASHVRRLLEDTLTEWFDWAYARSVIDRKLDRRFQSSTPDSIGIDALDVGRGEEGHG